MKKRIVSLLLILIISLQFNTVRAEGFTDEDKTKALLVADSASGKIFYEKNIDEQLPIASISKIMTYLVVMDEVASGNIKLDEIVKVSKNAGSLNKLVYSNMNLSEGDEVSVKELLEWLMVSSANDGAIALAERVSGSVEEFVKRMNQKTEELGLKGKFINPHGITENRGTEENPKVEYNTLSAREVFTLANHILKTYPEVVEYGAISSLTSNARNYSASSTLPNRERPEMVGLKTGTEGNSGSNVVSYFDMSKQDESQKYTLITVVLGAETQNIRNKINGELVDFVTGKFSFRNELTQNESIIDIKDTKAVKKLIPLYPEKDFSYLIEKNKNIELTYTIKDDLKAPYEDRQIMGEIILSSEGNEIERINLINKGYNAKESFFSNLISLAKEFFDSILLLF